MKVNQDDTVFQPVTITLTYENEVSILKRILSTYIDRRNVCWSVAPSNVEFSQDLLSSLKRLEK